MTSLSPVPISGTEPVPSAEVRVFISYAHQDRSVALALERILKKVNKSRVNCFVDVNSIDAGTRYEEVIRERLSQADWFIGIFTGEHSEYCGFEVGSSAKLNGPPHRIKQAAACFASTTLPPRRPCSRRMRTIA
jgi:hypothetical protein